MDLEDIVINVIEKRYAARTKILYSEFNFYTPNRGQIISTKPRGAWYSWGSIWTEFLMSSDWGRKWIKKYKYAFKLTIDFSKIIRIRTPSDFRSFNEKYKVPCSEIEHYDGPNWQGFKKKDYKKFKFPDLIDWTKVVKKYHGIDIRYNDKEDERYFWYRGWDCSSGCIWNEKAIKKVVEIL